MEAMLPGLIIICILLLSFVYWCVDEKKGMYAGTITVISFWVFFLLRYLGIHFPVSVAGGILFAVYFTVGKRIEALFAEGGLRAGMIASAALSFAMILYRPSVTLLIPGSMIFGLGAGYSLCKYYFRFSASAFSGRAGTAKFLIMLARFLTGIAILIFLYLASERIMGGMDNSGNFQLYFFLRYVLLALWISAGAPWLFRLLHLAGD